MKNQDIEKLVIQVQKENEEYRAKIAAINNKIAAYNQNMNEEIDYNPESGAFWVETPEEAE